MSSKVPASLFLNREWSWLEFNSRVLDEAYCEDNPLLERLKFLAIVSSNLDEFYMVRVAGLKRQADAGDWTNVSDGNAPSKQMRGVAERVKQMIMHQEEALRNLVTALAKEDIEIVSPREVEGQDRIFLTRQFEKFIEPVLTPIAVDPTHPFPTLLNCRLYLLVVLKGLEGRELPAAPLAFVEVPQVLPRFIRLPSQVSDYRFCALEDVITHYLHRLFAGYEVQAVHPFRITRDADLEVDADESVDLLTMLQDELAMRSRGAAVRLEYAKECPPHIIQLMVGALGIPDDHVFALGEWFQLQDLFQLVGEIDLAYLKDEPLPAVRPDARKYSEDIFETIRADDIFLYHPYHSFDPVVELVSQAADDDDVLAIKQTLYRTSGDSPIIKALSRAAAKGKQVTALVELRARFDEKQNILWAQRLEKKGVHVIYGLLGLKTHCKALLIVRKEKGGIRRYLHLSTGNYNDKTAKLYTDMGLMTCNEELAMDGSSLFNVITGYSEPPEWNKIEMAPTGLRQRILMLIEREIQKSTAKRKGHIIAKMNSLVDRQVIEALYRASEANVQIDLVVRGVCCLRPGVDKYSTNIRVISIVGRYLEHARVFYFKNGGKSELYLSSADWMPRNFDNRIETFFPVESEKIKETILDIMKLQLKDNVKAHQLLSSGKYEKVKGKRKLNSQMAVHELVRKGKKAAQRQAAKNKNKGPFIPLKAPRKKKS